MWLGLFVLAIVNGAFREIVLKVSLGFVDPFANQISCMTGILLLSLFTIWGWTYLNFKSIGEAYRVGLGWFLLTLLIETFIIDRKMGWMEVLKTYDVSQGQYWGLVLIWIGLMPVVFYYFLNIRHRLFS
jgi:hypothetical protein